MHAHAPTSQPIPIASSSRLNSDTRSTPRAAFSPATLRASSFGHRFFPSHSPAQPLGPLAMPDFNFKPSLSSSIETEHDSLVKTLAGDVMNMQEDMCRNYTCCGLELSDLHALVEHFEEAHVVVVDAVNATPTAELSGAAFDMDDMDMDSPTTPGTPSFPPSPPPTSAFDTTSVVSRRGSHMFSPYPAPHPGRGRTSPTDAFAALRRFQTLPEAPSAAHGACVQPALLFSPSATPSPMSTPAASRGTSPAPSSEACTPSPTMAPSSAAQVLPPAAPKPFRCPKPGCNKSYKQANGLKYHVTHGQCNFAPRDPNVDDHKPYLCQVGCNKRFKNMSGLRYHYQHTAEHGRAGLAMLQAGHLPTAV